MKDLAKRKRVMARSMRLGHCICDPAKPCPCDVLCEHDVCPCAGERLEAPAGPIRLTQLVTSAGCASKIDAATLGRVLAGLPAPDDPRVLVGMPAGDDAGVYRVNGHVTLVQTVDVFSPSVDDPYLFGQIAAANSLSDVYAMGGRPLTALSIIGFPARSLPDDVMRQILRGGLDKMAEAEVAVIGGHSIQDKEVKAGFAVTGVIDPERIATNAAARSGDWLLLTKPIGTGILAFAAQIGRAPAEGLAAASRSMAALNRRASELMVEAGAHACTDVTGFGLAGHLARLASASQVDIEIVWDDVPVFPGVLQCVAGGIAGGAVERNREASEEAVHAAAGIEPAMLDVLFDPQTSGGLLIAAPPAAAKALLARLHEEGIAEAAVIGRVLSAGKGRVLVRTDGRRPLPAAQSPRTRPAEPPAAPAAQSCCPQQETTTMGCCEDHPGAGGQSANPGGNALPTALQTQEKFQEFMKAAAAPGALDARTKRAVAIALSVLARCEPCLKSHIKKAREMGFSQEEIDEAGWLAVSFGGCTAMMFFNGLRQTT